MIVKRRVSRGSSEMLGKVSIAIRARKRTHASMAGHDAGQGIFLAGSAWRIGAGVEAIGRRDAECRRSSAREPVFIA